MTMAGTDEKLERMAMHVAYERNQLWLAHQLQEGLLEELRQVVSQGEQHYTMWSFSQGRIDWETRRNALLESILLHYRNLLEFLAPSLTGVSQQAVTARMFRDIPAPIRHRSAINDQLSHISKRRADLTEEERVWDDLSGMLDELEAAWQGFLRALEANFPNRVAWFTRHDSIVFVSGTEEEE